MEFNFTEANNFLHLLVIQLRDWNDFVYFPRLLILLYVIYLAWLLTFILFIKIMYDNDHLLKLKDFLKRKKKLI